MKPPSQVPAHVPDHAPDPAPDPAPEHAPDHAPDHAPHEPPDPPAGCTDRQARAPGRRVAARPILKRLRRWAVRMRRDVLALYLAMRDPRVPRAAKIVATLVAAYALSPIDLIPDFIPVLGQIDDLVLVPLGIALAVRMIPAPLMDELRREADEELGRHRPQINAAAYAIIILWSMALAGAIYAIHA